MLACWRGCPPSCVRTKLAVSVWLEKRGFLFRTPGTAPGGTQCREREPLFLQPHTHRQKKPHSNTHDPRIGFHPCILGWGLPSFEGTRIPFPTPGDRLRGSRGESRELRVGRVWGAAEEVRHPKHSPEVREEPNELPGTGAILNRDGQRV